MRLIIVRHAEAGPGEPDEQRALTPHGHDQARALGARLADDGVRADAILTSPLRRARETAERLGEALGVAAEPNRRLAPGATVEDVREAISGRGETVVVVGHQPDCGEIAAALGADATTRFPTAGSCVLEVE
jgi:phosphohistidine phosphatase